MSTTLERPVIEIRPQPGPQEMFLATAADIAFYGGSAGSGKSFATIIDPLRHVHRPGFRAVMFRREMTRLIGAGSLWEESQGIYPLLGADSRMSPVLEWRFPSGAVIEMRHLQHDKDKHAHQGKQYAAIYFDEVTEFEEGQFWYLISRLRTTSGVRPYARGTCNPDPDSWVRHLIDWWIGPDGYPIPERSGVLRWFARVGDELVWADTRDQLLADNPTVEPDDPLSFTFIAARLDDNPALLAKDPSYRARLRALPLVERERLLGGNWNIRHSAGLLFKRAWCELVDQAPPGLMMVRAWDFAGTPPSPSNPDPDWTVGTKVGRGPGRAPEHYVLDAVRLRGSPSQVQELFIRTALADGPGVIQVIPQDPGEAGKTVALQRMTLPELQGIAVRVVRPTGDKVTRFQHASSLAEQGLLKVVRGSWNDWWFADLEAFPDATHDDTADSLSDAVNNCPAPSAFRVRGATA